MPTDLYDARAAIAAQLAGPSAAKRADKSSVAVGQTFHYLLVYNAGGTAHTVVISDTVPTPTTVISATGSKDPAPSVSGQWVNWRVPVVNQEAVTLIAEARGIRAGNVTNSATFSGTSLLKASTSLLIHAWQVYLPVLHKDF